MKEVKIFYIANAHMGGEKTAGEQALTKLLNQGWTIKSSDVDRGSLYIILERDTS